jgi:antitoxin YefM
MKMITYMSARRNLASAMDRVCANCAPVTITRGHKQKAVVMLSLAEYNQLEETAHLMRGPANARRRLTTCPEEREGYAI